MSDPHCRIARWRPKASPHLIVHALDRPSVVPTLRLDCSVISQHPIVGYAIVAWEADGSVQTACRHESWPVPTAMVPQFACEALRRHDVHKIVEHLKGD